MAGVVEPAVVVPRVLHSSLLAQRVAWPREEHDLRRLRRTLSSLAASADVPSMRHMTYLPEQGIRFPFHPLATMQLAARHTVATTYHLAMKGLVSQWPENFRAAAHDQLVVARLEYEVYMSRELNNIVQREPYKTVDLWSIGQIVRQYAVQRGVQRACLGLSNRLDPYLQMLRAVADYQAGVIGDWPCNFLCNGSDPGLGLPLPRSDLSTVWVASVQSAPSIENPTPDVVVTVRPDFTLYNTIEWEEGGGDDASELCAPYVDVDLTVTPSDPLQSAFANGVFEHYAPSDVDKHERAYLQQQETNLERALLAQAVADAVDEMVAELNDGMHDGGDSIAAPIRIPPAFIAEPASQLHTSTPAVAMASIPLIPPSFPAQNPAQHNPAQQPVLSTMPILPPAASTLPYSGITGHPSSALHLPGDIAPSLPGFAPTSHTASMAAQQYFNVSSPAVCMSAVAQAAAVPTVDPVAHPYGRMTQASHHPRLPKLADPQMLVAKRGWMHHTGLTACHYSRTSPCLIAQTST